jgi:hypothetical protein
MSRTGLEDFNDDAVIVPKRVMTQGLSKIKGMDDVRKGIFVDINEKREIGKQMDVVLLDAKTTRKLWREDGVKGLQCWSDDGIYPSAAVENAPSTQCRGCRYEKKDRIATLTMLDVKETRAAGKPVTFAIEFKKTAIVPVSIYIKSIKDRDKSAREFMSTLSVEKQTNDKGEWYIPGFSTVGAVPNELKQTVEDEFNRLVSSTEADDDTSGAQDDFPVDPDIPF